MHTLLLKQPTALCSKVCVCVCMHIICVCVLRAFLCTHAQGNVAGYLEQVDPWQPAPGGIMCMCVFVFLLMVTGLGTLAQGSAGACDSRANGSLHMSTPAWRVWLRHLGSFQRHKSAKTSDTGIKIKLSCKGHTPFALENKASKCFFVFFAAMP